MHVCISNCYIVGFLLVQSCFDVADASLHERGCVHYLIWENCESSLVVYIISCVMENSSLAQWPKAIKTDLEAVVFTPHCRRQSQRIAHVLQSQSDTGGINYHLQAPCNHLQACLWVQCTNSKNNCLPPNYFLF